MSRISTDTRLSDYELGLLFDALDTDGNGWLTVEELQQGSSHLFLSGAPLPRRKVLGRIRADTAAEFLMRADKDGDGKIMREEWIAAIREQENTLWHAFERLGGEGAAPSAAAIRAAFEPYFSPDEPEQLARFVPVALVALSGDGGTTEWAGHDHCKQQISQSMFLGVQQCVCII